jgi:uncharacterized membrane protein YqhA
MLKVFFRIRYMVVVAVIAALMGALLLLLIGGWHVIEAFLVIMGLVAHEGAGDTSSIAVVRIIDSVDNFLLAFVLLYFAYSTYFLFIHDGTGEKRWGEVSMPGWLQVETLGEMKKVLLQVILVLVAVFLLETIFTEGMHLEWTTLILPVTILVIAISLRLVKFE